MKNVKNNNKSNRIKFSNDLTKKRRKAKGFFLTSNNIIFKFLDLKKDEDKNLKYITVF